MVAQRKPDPALRRNAKARTWAAAHPRRVLREALRRDRVARWATATKPDGTPAPKLRDLAFLLTGETLPRRSPAQWAHVLRWLGHDSENIGSEASELSAKEPDRIAIPPGGLADDLLRAEPSTTIRWTEGSARFEAMVFAGKIEDGAWTEEDPLRWLIDELAAVRVNEEGISAVAEVVEAVRTRCSADAATGLLPTALEVRDLRREDPKRLPTFEAEAENSRLSLFGGPVARGPIVPAPGILTVFDLTDLDSGSRRGASFPLALAVEFGSESIGRRYGTDPMTFTLREIVRRLQPNGWQRNRDLPRLLAAFRLLDSARIVIPNGLGGRTALRPFLFRRDLPTVPTLDDSLEIEIQIPPHLGKQGILIDRRILRRDRPASATRYRSELAIRALWDKYGTGPAGRIRATIPEVQRGPDGVLLDRFGRPVLRRNGSPVKAWNDPRAVPTGERVRNPAANRIPVLDSTTRAALAYNPADWNRLTAPARANRRTNADKALRAKEAAGDVVIEAATDPKTGRRGWRILEPWKACLSGALDLPTR